MRLFVALPLPPQVQDHLDLAVSAVTVHDALGDPARGPHPLRWVPLDQRHITLAFYGEVPAGALPELAGALAGTLAGFAPLRLHLRGAGVFSHRTLWVGVHEDREGPADGAPQTADEAADGLVTLMAACEDVGEPFSRMDRRDRHRAHVTVARSRNRRPAADDLASRAHALSVYAGPPWTAAWADLVESEPGAGRGGGPRYSVVERFTLGDGDGDGDGDGAADGTAP